MYLKHFFTSAIFLLLLKNGPGQPLIHANEHRIETRIHELSMIGAIRLVYLKG